MKKYSAIRTALRVFHCMFLDTDVQINSLAPIFSVALLALSSQHSILEQTLNL